MESAGPTEHTTKRHSRPSAVASTTQGQPPALTPPVGTRRRAAMLQCHADRLRCVQRILFHQLYAGHGLEILVVHHGALLLRDIEGVEDLQRYAWIHGAAFGIERAVGGEHDLVVREELEPAFRC